MDGAEANACMSLGMQVKDFGMWNTLPLFECCSAGWLLSLLMHARCHHFMCAFSAPPPQEFCHGDMGRTIPSVADLLSAASRQAAGGAATGTETKAELNGEAETEAKEGAATAAGQGQQAEAAGGGGDDVRVEILQLDVLAVHMEEWP